MSFFGNDDPYRLKNQQKSWTWLSRVYLPNFAVVRRDV